MKIIWLCNTLLPNASKKTGGGKGKPESWISGTYDQIKSSKGLMLFYLFPNNKKEDFIIDNAHFISYIQKKATAFEKEQVKYFERVLEEVKPDIIHIFGTEYPHTYAMMKAAQQKGLLDKTIIHIQGLCFIYAHHYFAGLDNKTIHAYTLRDLLKRSNIYRQRSDFIERGKYEVEALKIAKHVIGRTDWDEACTKLVNPNINYHFGNETLRKPFYENGWDIEKCKRHSIFVSQSSYPIKGFHHMLKAMTDILKVYPDAHLYTTGTNPLKKSWKQKIRQSYYSKYLGNLIKKYKLENNVTFLGYLDGDRMCEFYLQSNVFVCCSSIENSPNSLGEAMILGVPCVTSDIGGVKNLLEHEKEGFVFQSDASYMISYYVKKIFENDKLAVAFSEKAKRHAQKTHDPQKNFDRLLEIYEGLVQ